MTKSEIDWVYPLGDGSKHDNLELRLSLRSLERWVNPKRVIVVGSNPGFLSDKVLFIPNKPPHKEDDKEFAIMRQFRRVCEDKRVSSEFVMVNDDYVLLSEVKPGFYYKGTLEESMVKFTGSIYYHHLLATYTALKGRGYQTLNFDVHAPQTYDKKKLLQVIDSYDWTVPMGYCLKSLYCNTLGIEGDYIPDYKLYRGENWEGWPMVSLPDEVNGKMLKTLLTLFPSKSKFEI